jgi:hypothetical protein
MTAPDTAPPPLSEAELAAIRERATEAKRIADGFSRPNDHMVIVRVIRTDVPRLVAEVERLRAVVRRELGTTYGE